jgi:Tfp pilus assembly protein PilO
MNLIFFLLQIPEAAPEAIRALERSALNPLWETSGLFALMGIIIVILGYAFWKVLMKYLKKLEDESDQTKVMDNMRQEQVKTNTELALVKNELALVKSELMSLRLTR